MATLSAIGVVHALDDGVSELHQVTALLCAAGHDAAAMPVGAGDRALVGLVAELTGAPLELTAACPACGAVNAVAVGPGELAPYEPRWRWLGRGCGVREPTYGDLADLPSDPVAAAALVARRCTIGAVRVVDAVAALDDVDCSLAGPIELRCVECATSMAVDVDIEQLALERLRGVAAQADHEVHLLAAEYAWDLQTIEALPDRRRARLAGLVEQGR